MAPLITGVAIVLAFSIWPFRAANGLLCMGVVIGGFVAGWMQGRTDGDRLESTRALMLGAKVGLIASAIVMLVNIGGALASAGNLLDPLPRYIYAAIYGIWDGLVDLVTRSSDWIEEPGPIARYLIMFVSTGLFGAFGAAVASSLFVEQPNLSEMPERMATTPEVGGYMRHADAHIFWQTPREAQTFEAPAWVPTAEPAAATGTYGPASPSLERPRAALSVERPEHAPSPRQPRPTALPEEADTA